MRWYTEPGPTRCQEGDRGDPLAWQESTALPAHPNFGPRRGRAVPEVMRPAASLDDEGAAREVEANVSAKPDPWATRLQKVRDRLAQARAWRAWLDAEPGRMAVELARREGVSGPRVCQVTRLLDLAPEIIADLEREGRSGPVPSEKQLRAIALEPDRLSQVRRYRGLVEAEEQGGEEAGEEVERVAAPTRPHQRGFQRARARYYQGLIDGETVRSESDIARIEGITSSRVGQVLALLNLAPQIVAILDVPEGLGPTVTHQEVLRIARIKGKREQMREFWGVVSRQEELAAKLAPHQRPGAMRPALPA